MVDEREERYEGDEGEYHFTDDQMGYEEAETPKSVEAPIVTKESIGDKLSKITPRRRAIIAGVVFIILMSIVYKMLSPSQPSAPGSEFSQMSPGIQESPPKTIKEPVQTAQTTPAKPVTMPAANTAPTTATAAPIPTPGSTMTLPPQEPSVPAMQPQNVAQQTTSMNPPVITPEQQPAMAPPVNTSPVVIMTPPPAIEKNTNTDERLASLEQQNKAVMNLLQTEYAQKMSDYENQNNLVRGKMDELNKRINRIEASLSQITQLLQQGLEKPPTSPHTMTQALAVPHVSSGPKMTYTVQAIIPGRAWLKSESGDTVTVAEGDILKNYGRIAKIDPYDGVVDIDTGNKVITLSYGMTAE